MRCLGRAVRTVAQRATGADSRRTAPQCALPGARRGARRRAAPPVLSASRWQSELEELAAERAGDSPPPPVRATTKGFGAPRVKRAALEVQLYPNPCLRAPNADVTAFDAQLAQLTRDMFAVMYATDGVGLAAPQVGVNQRLMVYNPEGVPGRGVEVVLCNPVLEESSEKEDLFEEGCLSFPEIYADVRVRAHSATHSATALEDEHNHTNIR